MLNFDEDFKNFNPDASNIGVSIENGNNLKELGLDPNSDDDTQFGADFVYCGSHMRSHSTGWCTVRLRGKRPLNAKTPEDARAEVQALGFPIFS